MIYRPPTTVPLCLSVPPRLESWDAKEHPAQVALQAFLDHVEDVVGPLGDGELAVRLSVGLPVEISLTSGGHDLDNYLFPVVRRLGMHRFVSAQAVKVRGPVTICVGPAAEGQEELVGWDFATAHTTLSAGTTAWKREVAEQVRQQVGEPAKPLAAGLDLQVAFRVGPRRAWGNLWKPTIDALGAILGVDDPARPYMPRDDRIVSLGLHRSVDPTVGYEVQLGIWWRLAPS